MSDLVCENCCWCCSPSRVHTVQASGQPPHSSPTCWSPQPQPGRVLAVQTMDEVDSEAVLVTIYCVVCSLTKHGSGSAHTLSPGGAHTLPDLSQ